VWWTFSKKKVYSSIVFRLFAQKNATHFDVDRKDTQHNGIELCHKPLGLKDAAFF
jgi:hypothetical protein